MNRKESACLSFIPKYVGGSVFICVGFYGICKAAVVSIPVMSDGVVVLTNVLYIFLLVLILALERESVVSCRV